jgi:branched-chain amino acid transport system substrate-binding protein
VANSKKVISFSPCGGDIKLGNMAIGKYVFTMATDAEASGALMADWAYQKQGWRTAYVLTDTIIEYTKSVCRGFDKRWVELGGKAAVLGRDTYKNDDPSVSAQVTRFKALPKAPDVIAICGVTPGFPAAIRQFRAAGINTPMAGGVSMDGDAWRDALPKELLNDVYYCSYSSARGDDPRRASRCWGIASYMRGRAQSSGRGHSTPTKSSPSLRSFGMSRCLPDSQPLRPNYTPIRTDPC